MQPGLRTSSFTNYSFACIFFQSVIVSLRYIHVKFRPRLQSMSFSFYKTEAGKVTQQVGLHGIPLSNFSSLFSHQALPTATLWNQHLVMLPPALACSLALWSPASDTGGPSKQLTAASEGQLSTSSLFNSHLFSTCNSSYSKS